MARRRLAPQASAYVAAIAARRGRGALMLQVTRHHALMSALTRIEEGLPWPSI
jgi:hypothetical protein